MEKAENIFARINRYLVLNSCMYFIGSFRTKLKEAQDDLRQQCFGAASRKLLELRDEIIMIAGPEESIVIKLKIQKLIKILITYVIPDILEEHYQGNTYNPWCTDYRFDHCSTAYRDQEMYFCRSTILTNLANLYGRWNQEINVPPFNFMSFQPPIVEVLPPDVMPLEVHLNDYNFTPIDPTPITEHYTDHLDFGEAITATPEHEVVTFGLDDTIDFIQLAAENGILVSHWGDSDSDSEDEPNQFGNTVEEIYWKTVRDFNALHFYTHFEHEKTIDSWTILMLWLLKQKETILAMALYHMPSEIRSNMLNGIIDDWVFDDTIYDPYWIYQYRIARYEHEFTHDESYLIACRLCAFADEHDLFTSGNLEELKYKIPVHNDTFFCSDSDMHTIDDEITDPYDFEHRMHVYCAAKRVTRPRLCMSVL